MKNVSKIYFYIVICYLLTALILSSNIVQAFDTFYYWDWSRHLDISYFDGPPLIAYMIWISRQLFGDTNVALIFVGIITLGLTSYIIYKTAAMFLDKKSSFVAMALWLFSPFVTLDLLKMTSYDTPLALFWSLSIYYVIQYIKTPHNKTLYYLGISLGMLMLSKYTGAVLIMTLLLFIIFYFRQLFTNIHFYGAITLSLILFSPVIIWNYEHQWISFLYQLKEHAVTQKENINPLINSVKSTVTNVLPLLNFLLITLVLYAKNKKNDSNLIAYFCFFVSVITFSFYIILGSKVTVKTFWILPNLITVVLLAGYLFQKQSIRFQHSTYILIICYAIISLACLVNEKYGFLKFSQKFSVYNVMQQLNSTYPHIPDTIITTDWLTARGLFFLKNKPMIYTLNCGAPANQYQFWNQEFISKVKNNSIREAWYIAEKDSIQCLSPYFETCHQLPSIQFKDRKKIKTYYHYYCTKQRA